MGLGSQIGKVIDNFTITNDAGDKVQLRLTFDFSTSSDNDIRSWLCGNRRIALQRPSRSLSRTELEELNNQTLMAIDAGKKVKSLEERKQEARATLAALKAAHPEEYQAIMNELEVNTEAVSE